MSAFCTNALPKESEGKKKKEKTTVSRPPHPQTTKDKAQEMINILTKEAPHYPPSS